MLQGKHAVEMLRSVVGLGSFSEVTIPVSLRCSYSAFTPRTTMGQVPAQPLISSVQA